MNVFPSSLYTGPENLNAVLAAFPQYKWKVQDHGNGSSITFAVCGGNREIGEVFVMVCLVNAEAPKHEHIAGGVYGEAIFGLAGVLHDITDEGEPFALIPGTFLIHAGGTIHSPHALDGFWLGAYHQPRGSRTL